MESNDRTLEFFNLVKSQEGDNVGIGDGDGHHRAQNGLGRGNAASSRKRPAVTKDIADFHRTSANVHAVVAAANKKLLRLQRMVERTRAIHSSNEVAVTQLIASVKGDLAQASEAVATLDKILDHITQRGSQMHDHCLHVVGYLEGRILNLTGVFKNVLKRRHVHMKSSSRRKEMFGAEFAQLDRPLTFGNSAHDSKDDHAHGAASSLSSSLLGGDNGEGGGVSLDADGSVDLSLIHI